MASFLPQSYEENGTEIASTTYENALGKFEIALYSKENDYQYDRKDRIVFDRDGKLLSAPLFKSPDATVKVIEQDVFIKGESINKSFGKRMATKERMMFSAI